MADLRAQALSYVRQGQVLITTVATAPEARYPCLVVATVYGHNGRYVVQHMQGRAGLVDGWTCTCWRSELCPHIASVGMSTGSPALAARTDPIPAPRSS